jgi:hypothetical protein
MAKKTAQVTFKKKNGDQAELTQSVTVNADGSVLIVVDGVAVPQGRIVPGTDVAIVIDGKTFKGKAATRPGPNNSTELTLPAGTITGAAATQ